jgi:hypothetical protein
MIFVGLILLVVFISMHEAGLFLGPVIVVVSILLALSALANIGILLEVTMPDNKPMPVGLLWAALPLWAALAALVIVPVLPGVASLLYLTLVKIPAHAVSFAPIWLTILLYPLPFLVFAYTYANDYRYLQVKAVYKTAAQVTKTNCFDFENISLYDAYFSKPTRIVNPLCQYSQIEKVAEEINQKNQRFTPFKAYFLGTITFIVVTVFLMALGILRLRRLNKKAAAAGLPGVASID